MLMKRVKNDPFTLLRQMVADVDRIFAAPPWPDPVGKRPEIEAPAMINWVPGIDVFEKDGRLVTRIDLPGVKREDVKVEVTDGQLAISGERKSEIEETKDQFYRCEREYGQFYRAVALPDGVKLEDITAEFADGVLDVSVPLPVAPELKVRQVEVKDGAKDGVKAIKPAA